jgi:DNA polymerase III subunit gamma/tau
MSQALYRKWRPQQWEQVVGQEHVVQTLRNAVASGRIAHAYLLAGPRGTGKTTTARLLAKAANCLAPEQADRPCDRCEHCLSLNQGRFMDLIEIDAASNTSVEDVRSLRDKINFSPNLGRYKVYIIDEVHMLSTAAFNALLKTLEEPPAHAIFILATTEVHKIPATVLSRCQRHEFRRIPVAVIVNLLSDLASSEGMQVQPEALTLIARQSTGSLRDAISLLDQLASSGEAVTLESAHNILGTAASQSVLELVETLLSKNTAVGLDLIHAALDAGSDPRQFARQVVDYLRNVLLVLMKSAEGVEASAETRAAMAAHSQKFSLPDLLNAIRAFNYAATEARLSFQPALPLELALIESIEGKLPQVESSPAGHHSKPGRGPSPESHGASRGRPSSKEGQSSTEGPPTTEGPHPGASPVRGPTGTPAPSSEAGLEGGSTSGSASGSVTMEMVRQNWSRIGAQIRTGSPQTQAYFLSCQALGFKDGCLVLGTTDFVKARLETSEHTRLVERVLEEVLGQAVPIRCIVSSGKVGAPPDVDSNGIVATALRDLGGEIVDVQ